MKLKSRLTMFYCVTIILVQGLLFSTPESLKSPMDLIRLWNHECNRVYRDKLVDDKDMEHFDKIQLDFNRKFFEVSINLLRTTKKPNNNFKECSLMNVIKNF